MDMSQEDLIRFLSMGTNEENLSELLRQQERQEGLIDETRGADTTKDAGNGNLVPNFADPISGIFQRGRAKKALFKNEGEQANLRAGRDQDIAAFLRGMGEKSAAEDPASQSAIAGKSPMPMPSPMPQVTAPPSGPVGPPGPAPAPTPSPAQPPVPGPVPGMTPDAVKDAQAKVPSEMPANQTGYPHGAGPGNGLRDLLAKLLGMGG